ncbi:hypothetical protein NEUTE2DRAFT_159152 [Neurospora tetrasperma FGSC 2509]|nr:hypothetical protein NEUTE2DRAFT_159152 [Neurospora tetrasperma FGSC 2509]
MQAPRRGDSFRVGHEPAIWGRTSHLLELGEIHVTPQSAPSQLKAMWTSRPPEDVSGYAATIPTENTSDGSPRDEERHKSHRVSIRMNMD